MRRAALGVVLQSSGRCGPAGPLPRAVRGLQRAVARLDRSIVLRRMGRREKRGADLPVIQKAAHRLGDEARTVVRLQHKRRAVLQEQPIAGRRSSFPPFHRGPAASQAGSRLARSRDGQDMTANDRRLHKAARCDPWPRPFPDDANAEEESAAGCPISRGVGNDCGDSRPRDGRGPGRSPAPRPALMPGPTARIRPTAWLRSSGLLR